jgi:AraC family transcriptional activator of pobA
MDRSTIKLHYPTIMEPSPKIPSYRLYAEKADDPADFWVHCEPMADRTHLHNWEIALHRHEQFFQLFLLPIGSGEIVTQDATHRFDAPVIVFIPPDVAHGFRFTRDIDGLVVTALADRLHMLAHADKQIGHFASRLRIASLTEKDVEAARAAEAIRTIGIELAGHGVGRALLLEPLMTQALVALTRSIGTGAPADAADPRQERVQAFLTIVDTHFRRRPPISFFAERLAMSPTHLSRIVRMSTGMSVQALLDRRTLEAARRDLIFTPTPIAKIAFSLGFSDPAYFNRFFRRQTGMTPGAFRARERRRLSP